MRRILPAAFFLMLCPYLSSAKDVGEICPEILRFLKAPLPVTLELNRKVLSEVLDGLSNGAVSDDSSQAELFCRDARLRLWDRIREGMPEKMAKDKSILLLVGEYHFLRQDFEAARDAFYAVHQQEPENVLVAIRLAKIAEALSQPEAQRAYLDVAMRSKAKDPSSAAAQSEAYLQYVSLLPKAEAESFISKKWAKDYPGDYRRALALIKIGEKSRDPKTLEAGVDLLGRLAPDAKTSSLVFFFRGSRYCMERDFRRCQADLQSFLKETLHDESREPEAIKMLVEATEANRLPQETVYWLERAFEKGWLNEPRFLQLHENSIRETYFPGVEGFNHLKKSMSYHSKSLAIESALAQRALELSISGELLPTQAGTAVENVETDYPDSPEAAFFRARYLQMKKQFSQAQVYFNSAQSRLQSAENFLDPSVRDDFLVAGARNLLSLGKPEEAKAWTDWARRFSPPKPDSKNALSPPQKIKPDSKKGVL
jgi:tetratricopeptide (TPR) repeat protein